MNKNIQLEFSNMLWELSDHFVIIVEHSVRIVKHSVKIDYHLEVKKVNSAVDSFVKDIK